MFSVIDTAALPLLLSTPLLILPSITTSMSFQPKHTLTSKERYLKKNQKSMWSDKPSLAFAEEEKGHTSVGGWKVGGEMQSEA